MIAVSIGQKQHFLIAQYASEGARLCLMTSTTDVLRIGIINHRMLARRA